VRDDGIGADELQQLADDDRRLRRGIDHCLRDAGELADIAGHAHATIHQ
jgi:hypothetical protein